MSQLKNFKSYCEKAVDYLAAKGLVLTTMIGLVIGAGLFYGFYSYLIDPMATTNARTEGEVEALQKEVKAALAIEAGETEFRAEFKRVVLKVKQAEPFLPKETQIAEILGNIQASAEKQGVILKGLNAAKSSTKQADGKLYEREMPAVAVGTMPQVIRFFYDIANQPRIFVIKDFSILTFKDKVSCQFNLSAYNSPPPAEMPNLPPDLQSILNGSTVAQK